MLFPDFLPQLGLSFDTALKETNLDQISISTSLLHSRSKDDTTSLLIRLPFFIPPNFWTPSASWVHSPRPYPQ